MVCEFILDFPRSNLSVTPWLGPKTPIRSAQNARASLVLEKKKN